jgi:CheY-like chemotaxis protein
VSGVDVTQVKILIVEDNVHFRTLIYSILQALGISDLEEARDGSEALEILDELTPDLVILDWKMEGMDGVECVRQIRTLNGVNRFVPIIMVTGYTETSLKKEARDAGVNDFLGKPISPQSLLGRIVSVMDNRRPFYETDDYFGPDRRSKVEKYSGAERRKTQRPPVQKA